MKSIRVSVGSAARLGLQSVKIDCLPTTIYVMTPGHCRAGCQFCAQNAAENRLSRVIWPEYPLKDVISALHDERVCIQCLNYKSVFSDILELTDHLQGHPISVSAQPFSEDELRTLSHRVDRIAINLDCATPQLFRKIKPYYSWEDHLSRLRTAVDIFGPFRVTSHVIAGLGETEEQMVTRMTYLHDHSIYCSLFAFTPLAGTPLSHMPKPSIGYYRRLQVAHYCLYTEHNTLHMEEGRVIDLPNEVPPEAFMTRGCPGCNRPYYTETPRNLYNFPYIPSEEDMKCIRGQLSAALHK
jgi:biotin synthase